MKKRNKFDLRYVRTTKSLKDTVDENLLGKEKSYYLFVSDWDTVSNNLLNKLEHNRAINYDEDMPVLNIVDIWDVPNGLDIVRNSIQQYRETMSVASIRSYTTLPMLLVLHKAFPRAVEYNGSIWVELGA